MNIRKIAKRIGGLSAVVALSLPAAASAHVVLLPNSVPAGSENTFNVRVPNEQDNARTVKVDVQLPPGILSASYAPVPGWTGKVITTQLPKPMMTDDGPVTQEVSEVIWTATGGGIGAGQFQLFPLTMLLPGKEGQTLTFKALQTYSNGDVVRWIGTPSASEPAPTVKLTAASGDAMGMAQTEKGEHSSSDDGLAIAALVLGGFALVIGIVALVLARRRKG